jgi:hypothetical protein
MKKLSLALFAIAMMAAASFAQGKANYSGTWTLDKEKSTLGGPMRIESMTLTVAQTDKDIKVETVTKRQAPPEGAGAPTAGAPGGGPGRGPGGRGGFGAADGTTVYSLDGKETKTEVDGPMGKMPVTHKGSAKTDGSLELSSSRTFSGQMGEVTMTTKETWKLTDDGKTLTVDRVNSTPRGDQTAKLVFTKS